MKLQEWIKITGIKQAQLARMLGISGQRMTRILKHGLIPHHDEMVKLFWITCGAVRPDDFYDIASVPAELRHLLTQPTLRGRTYEHIDALHKHRRHRRKRPALDH